MQVAAGIYRESIDKLPSGSSSSNLFTLKCATSRVCTIQPGNRAAILINKPSSYIEIRGFVIDGENFSSAGGIYASAWKAGITTMLESSIMNLRTWETWASK